MSIIKNEDSGSYRFNHLEIIIKVGAFEIKNPINILTIHSKNIQIIIVHINRVFSQRRFFPNYIG